jgi:hypothetical protein
MNENESKVRRGALVIALVVVLAVIIGVFWHGIDRDVRRDAIQTANGNNEPTAESKDATVSRSTGVETQEVEAIGSTGDAPPPESNGNQQAKPMPAAPVAEATEYVIAARDVAGVPVPRVNFEFVHLSFMDYTEMRRQGQGLTAAFAAARFDEAGEWRVRATPESFVCIRVTEPGWACVISEDRSWPLFPTGPDIAVFRLTPRGDTVHTLQLLRKGTCHVYINYEDGEPYEGSFSYALFKDERQTEFVQPFRNLTYREGMTVHVVGGTWLRLTVSRAPRAGYHQQARAELSPEEMSRGRVDVVIAAQESRREPAGLILDHNEFQPGQKMLAVMVSKTGSFDEHVIELIGPGETKTEFVTPGWHRLIAFGDGIAWSSGALVLEPGEWRRVVITPSEPASLRLQIQDEDGNPMSRCVVSLREFGREDWRTSRLNLPAGIRHQEMPDGAPETRRDMLMLSRGQSRGYPDERGEVFFRRVWTGEQIFLVEAEGYETSSVNVTLYPGQHLDYGVVRMRRAQAVVTVRAIHAPDANPLDYRFSLLIPGGGRANSEPVTFNEDGVAVIEHVPENRYQVMITQRGRGRGWSRWLEVRSGERYEVTIDVTREFGMQED